MPEHTPTPWGSAPTGNMATDYSQPFAIYAKGEPSLVAGCFGDTRGGIEAAAANAAFIVKAVNCHDELMAAARRVLDGLNARIDAASAANEPVPVFDGIADLRAALAKVEAA